MDFHDIADIGAADGDFDFFLERELNCAVDLIDHAPTNFNKLRGEWRLAAHLGSSARIHEIDLDEQFSLPQQNYSAIDPDEANHDSTNYWIFSVAGLCRILARTGWDVLDLITVGCPTGSDPGSSDRDERAFCLLRSAVRSNP